MDQSQSRPVRQSMPAGRICDRGPGDRGSVVRKILRGVKVLANDSELAVQGSRQTLDKADFAYRRRGAPYGLAELSVTDPDDDIGERSDKAAISRSRLAPREERSYLAAAICLSHNPVPARSFPVQSEEC
jgi:hypothetical protein